MTEVNPPYVEQTGSHPADVLRRMFETSVRREGVMDVAALKVSQNSPLGMSVRVAAGLAAVKGDERVGQGIYGIYNDAVVVKNINAAHASLPRKDLIVARVRDTTEDSSGVAAWDLFYIAGTAAASPAEPAVPNNCLKLAVISVAALATQITDANIADTRTVITAVVPCTSTTQPPVAGAWAGQILVETDTNKLRKFDGTRFTELLDTEPTTFVPVAKNETRAAVTATVSYASYWRFGKLIIAQCKLVLTSNSAGTGEIQISLPVESAGPAHRPIGTMWFNDASAAAATASRRGIAVLDVGTPDYVYLGVDVGDEFAGITTQLGSSDGLGYSVIYEAQDYA